MVLFCLDPPLKGEVAARSADRGVSPYPRGRHPSTILRMVPLPVSGGICP
jgi:hypothetical protein